MHGAGYADEKKAKILDDNVEMQYTVSGNENDDEDLEEKVENTNKQLHCIIKSLKSHKAFGEDLLTNTAIKRIPRMGLVCLNYFVAKWKGAISNHHRISLLVTISKSLDIINQKPWSNIIF